METPNRLGGTIRSILEGMDVGKTANRDALRKLVRGMQEAKRERILRSALQACFEAEALKPYQSGLIKLQAHLEERGARPSSCSTAAMHSAKGEHCAA